MTLGSQIKQLRQLQRWTKIELAHQISEKGIKTDSVYVGRWENDIHVPKLKVMKVIASLFNCKLKANMCGDLISYDLIPSKKVRRMLAEVE